MAAPQGTASLRRLKKRSQFLRAARGNRAGRPSFALHAVPVAEAEPGVGLTVSKQVGNSPQRNRVKRRLRAAVRACAAAFQPQHDYVLIARREALGAPFGVLVGDLEKLIARVDAPPSRPAKDGRQNRGPRKGP
jgi:ribonuclease P protein component